MVLGDTPVAPLPETLCKSRGVLAPKRPSASPLRNL